MRTKRHLVSWLQRYETLIVSARPDLAGRIDWDTAHYLFNQGLTAEQAAIRIIEKSHD